MVLVISPKENEPFTDKITKVKEEHDSGLTKGKSNWLGRFMPKFNLGKHPEYKKTREKNSKLVHNFKRINFKVYFKNL